MTTQLLLTILACSLITPALAHGHKHHQEETTYDITANQAWGYGLLAGTGLSLLGLLAALMIVGLQNIVS